MTSVPVVPPAFRGRLVPGALLPLLLLAGCATSDRRASETAAIESPPPAPREFRAAWVSTVSNIDWPSRRGESSDEQRAEITAILDRVSDLNLNAVILQVRPAADALYPSRLEPWSEYLTGTQGVAPKPYYDPLQVWITEAHRRGIELHAWLNPYRARHSSARSPLARNHLANLRPGSVKKYGDLLWMDPGDWQAASHTLDVVRDIVSRYDVDGVHLDDYFYPYPIAAVGDFPDEPSWQRYLAYGGTLSRADWRRDNVNRLMEAMHRVVHETKPWVLFGVSPFGIGRPDRRPAGISGFSQYDQLYADAELWLQRGWLDYLSPQLYWRIGSAAQAFGVLHAYWAAQNTEHRHLWPGLMTSAVNTPPRNWPAGEIVDEVALLRTQSGNGHIHFSVAALMQDRGGVATALRAGPYAQPALRPATPWLGDRAPKAPTLALMRDGENGVGTVTIRPSWFGERPAVFAVWARYGSTWRFSVVPAARRSFAWPADPALGRADAIVVSAVDRLGNESARTSLSAPAN